MLAKQYHPDLNPSGKDQFNSILKAYEVLSDPQQKYVYDTRLGYGTAAGGGSATGRKNQDAAPKEKNWRFDERELRRRQYYNEHIKKYEKKQPGPVKETPQTAPYNEFKYILFATPLAVLLFVGIMHFANDNSTTNDKQETKISSATELKSRNTEVSDSPYTNHFGESYYYVNSAASLTLRNLSGADAVICLFDSVRFLRSFLLQEGFSATVPGLPEQHITLRYISGKAFDNTVQAPKQAVKGAFRETYGTYKTQSSFNLDAINQLTLLPGLNHGFEEIGTEEFFKKTL